jgi:hypothetical protein
MDIYTAAKQGRTDILEDLIDELQEQKKHLNCTRWSGHTALHRACAAGHMDCVELLVERGADIHVKSAWGWHTPLHMACAHAHVEIGQFLLEQGANWDAKDKNKRTPMRMGVDNGHSGILAMLQMWVSARKKRDLEAQKERDRLARAAAAEERARLKAEQLLREEQDRIRVIMEAEQAQLQLERALAGVRKQVAAILAALPAMRRSCRVSVHMVVEADPEFYIRMEKELSREEFDAMLQRPPSDCIIFGLTKVQFKQMKELAAFKGAMPGLPNYKYGKK